MQLLICLMMTTLEHFELHIERILGTSSSGNENLDVKFYIGTVGNATLDNGAATPYTVDNINLGNGTHRNVNGTDNMELFTTNAPNKGGIGTYLCKLWCKTRWWLSKYRGTFTVTIL